MASRTDLRRTDLGEHFSEGSRLLWQILEKKGWTQSQLREALGAHPGEISKLLYGDKKPRFDLIVEASRKFKIKAERWDEPPRVAFVPPAARAA